MSGAMSVGAKPSAGAADLGAIDGNGPSPAEPSEALPRPLSPATSDDLMTALGMLSMQQRHEDRLLADQQRAAASKAQDEAHAEKIAKMRELADDTFKEGLIEGILGGASAIASAASAQVSYDGAMNDCHMQSERLTRNGKLLHSASEGFGAGSKLGGAMAKADQENDRTDMAIADAAIDRAKASVDSAASESRRAQEDIRETMNAIRQYLAAKSQLANAAIIKG